MAEWITDRRPTKEDADENGHVLHSDSEGVFLFTWVNLTDGDPWMPVPAPYQPPQPDTSLRASIERAERWMSNDDEEWVSKYGPTLKFNDDYARIIEAARRWDDSMRETTLLADEVANDLDGVGEG